MEKNALRKLSAVMAALLFIVMVTANGLANALPLNGVNTGQLSDEIPNLFVLAGQGVCGQDNGNDAQFFGTCFSTWTISRIDTKRSSNC